MIKRLRLSTLIRQGSKHTHVKRNSVFGFEDDRVVSACAWGAARYSFASMIFEGSVGREEIMSTEANSPFDTVAEERIRRDHWPDDLDIHDSVSDKQMCVYVIGRINDDLKWSRTRIADYVDHLIDDHDYDLYVCRDVPTPAKTEEEPHNQESVTQT